MNNKIIIFDTTLRDGDQAPGFHFLPDQKIAMALALADLGVDVIETGFAVSSYEEKETMRKISKDFSIHHRTPILCSLARSVKKDIDDAAEALEYLDKSKKRVHIFLGTSEEHIKEKFGKDRNWILETAENTISYARRYFDEIEFTCEDFGRSDLDFTVEVVEKAIKAGARIIDLADTVGVLLPNESYERTIYVIQKIKERGYNPVFSVHCHNDKGLATANSIEAIRAGAGQVHVTLNGAGERAGNTALEEIVAIFNRKDEEPRCNINSGLIAKTSRMCSEFTGIWPQPNKAIVGKNAFAHQAGIHVDALIKNSKTYEAVNPEDFGYKRKFVLGPRSGRAAVRYKYREIGYEFSDDDFERVFAQFKSYAESRKEISDADLKEIAEK